MQDFEKLGSFYLGRLKDQPDSLLLYDSKDLVTHAVCVGMTGSGKTGLCIDLLEEAAIDGIPALIIDPKGDLTNLLLQFPDLKPEDFEPWINEDEAKSQGLTTTQFAEQQAKMWSEGLAKWGQSGERIRKLQQSANFAIYTPGSSAGLPLSILRSFAPPTSPDDTEAMRDRVGTTATALLSLMGIDAEPLKSRKHILLSTLFDKAWKEGQTLDLPSLIAQIQNPQVTRVGVLDLESFYPAKERFELAMSLNNLLASPGFEAWLDGDPMDIDKLLHTEEGKPRLAILSISHLSDSERLFFVSLVLNEFLSWTRAQSGTTSLRAILYMDEIFGYFPPVANPPTKKPLLTLLKQARAFGVGIALATQNPVDLDYKGLANCGTWFIGRLQTQRDKDRLLDGLASASADSGAHFDRSQMNDLLSSLGKRVFLMNNVHEDHPVVFESRWALSYLRGPLTRAQVKELLGERASPSALSKAPEKAVVPPPVLPPEINQVYLPARGASQVIYHPMVIGASRIQYSDPKNSVNEAQDKVFLGPIKDDSVPVQWEEATESDIDVNELEKAPAEGAQFTTLPALAAQPNSWTQWQKDFANWLYGCQQFTILHSPALDIKSNPGESERDFRVRLQQAAREERDRQTGEIQRDYAPKLAALQERLRKAQQNEEKERQQVQTQGLQTVLTVGASLLGAFMGRKVLSRTNLTAMTSAARSVGRATKDYQDVNRAQENVAAVQAEIDALNQQFKTDVDALATKIDPATEQLDTVCIKPKKTNISIRMLALCWAPYKADGTPAW